jgi:rhamnogalacturonan endolyase
VSVIHADEGLTTSDIFCQNSRKVGLRFALSGLSFRARFLLWVRFSSLVKLFAGALVPNLCFLVICLLGITSGFLAPASAVAAFGLTTVTDYYTVDTGAGLVFKVRRTDNGSSTQSPGDIMSLKYNGIEFQDQSRGSQINSGFDWIYNASSAVTVSGTTVGTNYIKITVVCGDPTVSGVLTHYYMVRKGDPYIYMATYFTSEPEAQALCRYILRIQGSVLPNGPAPSNLLGTDSTVESSDVFGFSGSNANIALRGQTRSKHYSGMRLKDWSFIGATGTNVGLWVVRDNEEGASGGPFFRCLLNQGTSTDQEITYIVNYGEGQTEAFRTNILNSYTLVFTNGATPPVVDTSWFSGMGLVGYVSPSARGSVTCSSITGRDTNYVYTVGFANTTAQYWTDAAASNGAFNMTGMLSGTYAMSIYKNELAVYSAANIVVTGSSITTLSPITLTADPSRTVPLWRIGNWDGTPTEFLYGDKINTMHPSDVRITGTNGTAAWNPGPFVVGTSTPSGGIPCYQWKDVNGAQVVKFNLTSNQLVASTVRIGITTAYAGGRPNISVNSWSNTKLPSASTQPDSRTLTVGTFRGNNTTYSFSVPASAFVSGTNVLTITPISGSSGTTYLSPGYSLDCIDLYQGTAQSLAVPNAPAALTGTGGNGKIMLNWTASAGAASYTVRRAAVSGGNYAIVASGVTTATYTDMGLSNGTPYYYVVGASNSSGSGLNSSEVSATPFVAPPAAPTNLTATAGNAQVTLGWTASTGADGYIVSRSLASGSGYTVFTGSSSSAAYTDTGVTNGTTYFYVVSAFSTSGTSARSAQVSAEPVQTFAQWQSSIFPGQNDPAIIGPSADPDGDGYSNLLEYFLATNPASGSDSTNAVTTTLDGSGNFVLTFRMSKNLSGVSYSIQQSSDLVTWKATDQKAVVISDQGSYYLMKATVPSSGQPKLFLRLSVTSP